MHKRVAATAIVVALAWGSPAVADTITIGATNSPNLFPFGVGPGEVNAYFGTYQQIYAAAAFPGPMSISQIAFTTVTVGDWPLSLTSAFSLSIGTTSASPSAPGFDYSANRRPDLVQVFSGSISIATTGRAAFDFIIPLTTPFQYDPSVGNLLLDVFIRGNSRGPVGFAGGDTWMTGRVYNFNGTGSPNAGPNRALLTRFSSTDLKPVPEPATFALLASGLAAIYARRRAAAALRHE
jgi:hypothetical protein